MSTGTVQLADVIVPEIFSPYTQKLTEEKSRLIQSGIVVRDSFLDEFLAGGGLTIHAPSWKDLDNDTENVSTSNPADVSAPNKIGTFQEVAVRLSRNNSWKTADLAGTLAGSDPADAIARRVAAYWTRRAQLAFVSTMKGVFADNDAAPTGTEHVQGDLTLNISGGAYVQGVTDFSAEAFVDTLTLMGDSQDGLGTMFVHSIVFARMQKNNMIDVVVDAVQNIKINTFLGREVIVDDGMPFASGVYESWLFGAGAVRMGVGSPKVPTATTRDEDQGNGGGTETLYNRVEWCLHPAGHRYAGTPAEGGPSNAATTNNLANAASWARVFPERKQIKIARLITRES